ncbi:MAG: hypothetical protein LBH32_09260 [Dysgonamonadaceae bacterium]|jgi:hypothetical protein|nr:hypothetical protein [Dysgonamonadaceae bacterium]
MLWDKVTTDFSELQIKQTEGAGILQSINSLKLSNCFSAFKSFKQQGYSFKLVLSLLIWMVLHSKKSLNTSLKMDDVAQN